MNPQISVIVPVYNAEKYIPACLESILNQTYSDFEVILVNDGSTDSSRNICEEYASKCKCIQVIHQKNCGVSIARNLGIDNAKGEWLYFVDADDIVKPDAIGKMLSLVSETTDIVMAGFEVDNEDGAKLFETEPNIDKSIAYVDALKEMYLPANGWYQGYLWCKLFRNSVVKEHHLRFENNIYFNEDRLFVVQYLCASKKNVAYSTYPVYCYYQRTSGAMSSIKQGFNRKYATDFDAYILMKRVIMQLPESSQLIWYADQGIRTSYEKIHDMMYKYHDCDSGIHWHLVSGLISSGVFIAYFKDLIRPVLMLIIPQYYCRKKANE